MMEKKMTKLKLYHKPQPNRWRLQSQIMFIHQIKMLEH